MLTSSFLTFIWCLLVVNPRGGLASISNETKVFDSLLENYDKNAAPSEVTGKPTNVLVGMYLTRISLSNENGLDMSYTGYLRLRWTDPRLDYSKLSRAPTIHLPEESLKKIWIPDIFFRNSKSSKFHEMVTPNRLLRLTAKGELFYVMKVSVVTTCRSSHRDYPFDPIECPILAESFSYTSDILAISPLNKFDVATDIGIYDFKLLRHETMDCSQNYTSGSYPCLETTLYFERNTSHFISMVCIPSIFLVIISWISFWFDHDATVARLLTGFLALVALTLISIQERHNFPGASQTSTSLDRWLIVCYSFVFATILEYLLVIVVSRGRNGASGLEILKPSLDNKGSETGSDGEKSKGTEHGRRKAVWVDWVSRIVFPIAFLIFLLCFWIPKA